MLKTNVSAVERIFRILVGAIGIALGLGLIGGGLGLGVALVSALVLLTGVVAFCPLWAMLGRELKK